MAVLAFIALTYPIAARPTKTVKGAYHLATERIGAHARHLGALTLRDKTSGHTVTFPEVFALLLQNGTADGCQPFVGPERNTRRKLPIWISSPLASTAESTGSRLR
jgi:hypothetical protein